MRFLPSRAAALQQPVAADGLLRGAAEPER